LLNDAGDLGAGEVLALVGRSTLLPLRGKSDVVAFISEPDSMISPSEGVDGDLDLREAMVVEPTRVRMTVGQNINWPGDPGVASSTEKTIFG
jgi:hypothetical protein